MDEQRLIDLEIKITHQDVLIEELQQALYEHHSLIEKLQKNVTELKERFEGAMAGEEIGPHNQKPPHY